VTRSAYEGARDFARDIAKTDAYATSRRERKKVELTLATAYDRRCAKTAAVPMGRVNLPDIGRRSDGDDARRNQRFD